MHTWLLFLIRPVFLPKFPLHITKYSNETDYYSEKIYILSTMLISFLGEVLTLHLSLFCAADFSLVLKIISSGSHSVICCWEKKSHSQWGLSPHLSHSKGGPIVFFASGNLHFVGVVFAQVEELNIPSLLLNFTPNAKTSVYKSYWKIIDY